MNINLLLYNFNEKEQKLLKNAFAMMPLGIKIVEKSEYLQPVGYLANLSIPPVEEIYYGNELIEKMIVLNNLSDEQLDNILKILRENLPFSITYKAIITAAARTFKRKIYDATVTLLLRFSA